MINPFKLFNKLLDSMMAPTDTQKIEQNAKRVDAVFAEPKWYSLIKKLWFVVIGVIAMLFILSQRNNGARFSDYISVYKIVLYFSPLLFGIVLAIGELQKRVNYYRQLSVELQKIYMASVKKQIRDMGIGILVAILIALAIVLVITTVENSKQY